MSGDTDHLAVRVEMPAALFPGHVKCIVTELSPSGAVASCEAPPGDPGVLVLWNSGAAFEVEAAWIEPGRVGLRISRYFDIRAPEHGEVEARTAWLNDQER